MCFADLIAPLSLTTWIRRLARQRFAFPQRRDRKIIFQSASNHRIFISGLIIEHSLAPTHGYSGDCRRCSHLFHLLTWKSEVLVEELSDLVWLKRIRVQENECGL